MIVKIDAEQVQHCKAIKYYREKYKIIIDHLEIGDYILKNDNDEVSFKYVLLYDLIFKIDKNILIKQLIKQYKNYEYNFLLIEWDKKKFKRKGIEIDKRKAFKIIILLSLFTTIIISPTKKKAFPLMEKYAKQCFNHEIYKNTSENNINQIRDYLMTIDNVNKIKARKICRKLNLNNVDDLLDLTIQDLVKVSGVGLVTAERIVSSIS